MRGRHRGTAERGFSFSHLVVVSTTAPLLASHIARFDPNEDRTTYTQTDLTSGAFVVTSILAWDSEKGYV